MEDVRGAISELKSAGWTGAAIADSLNVSWFTVDRWSKGTQEPASPRPVLVALRQLTRRRPPPRRRVTRTRRRLGAVTPARTRSERVLSPEELRSLFEAQVVHPEGFAPPAARRLTLTLRMQMSRALSFARRAPLRAVAAFVAWLWLAALGVGVLTGMPEGVAGYVGFAVFSLPGVWVARWAARGPPH